MILKNNCTAWAPQQRPRFDGSSDVQKPELRVVRPSGSDTCARRFWSDATRTPSHTLVSNSENQRKYSGRQRVAVKLVRDQ